MKLPRKQKQTGLVINDLTRNYSVGGEKPWGPERDAGDGVSQASRDRADGLAQQVKSVATKSDQLSSIPRTHLVEEDWSLEVILWSPQVHRSMHPHIHMHK